VTNKPGITIDIPGFGLREINTIVSDYTGTLSCRGKLVSGAREALLALKDLVDIRVITADTFGTAGDELRGLVEELFKLDPVTPHDDQKEEYVRRFQLEHVVAFGNGNNDRKLLKAVKEGKGLAIAIDNGEGCALDALQNGHIFIVGAVNALSLLLIRDSCKATLRF
jgi:soluble P-type ATPase